MAGSSNTPVSILSELAKDPEAEARKEVAGNPKTPSDVLIILASDPDWFVSRVAKQNPSFKVKSEIEQFKKDLNLINSFSDTYPSLDLEASSWVVSTYHMKTLLDDIQVALNQAGYDGETKLHILLNQGENDKLEVGVGETVLSPEPNPGTEEFREALKNAIKIQTGKLETETLGEIAESSGIDTVPSLITAESPFGLPDGGALAQLTERGIELRDDMPISDALRHWNIQHENRHKWLDGNTELSDEEKEVVAIILAFQEAQLDEHLRVLLFAFGVEEREIPQNLADKTLIEGVIQYLAKTRPGYRDALAGKERVIAKQISLIVLNNITPEEVPIMSVKDELYKTAQKLVPSIMHVIRRNAPTYDIAPANYEDAAKVMDLLKTTEGETEEKEHNINAAFYKFGNREDWYKNLEAKIEGIIDNFNRDAIAPETTEKTRMMIRLLDVGRRKAIQEFIIEKLTELNNGDKDIAEAIFNEKVLIIEEHVADEAHLNTVIDLFADIGIMEYDRYQKGAYSDAMPVSLMDNLANLLRLSATNLEEVSAKNLQDVLSRILRGDIVLMIKAIDWESIREWKKFQ